MKGLKRIKVATLLILTLGFPLAWLALSQQADRYESPIDSETYRTLMDRRIIDTADLEELVRDERWIYEQITPPVADFVLRQPVAPVIPFDWEHFPENLPELLGDRYQYEYSVPVYKLRAVEDRQTRQLHFYDGKERLFSIPAPADYDPFAWLKTRYPDLYSGRHALSAVRAVEERYDPARIELLVTLIPTDYVEHYLYAQAKVREYQLSLKEEEDGGFMLLGMGTESNIVITAMTHTTNGMELVIGYPDTFTNRLDVYRSTDLVEMDWQQVASALTTTGTNRIDWVDTEYDTGDIGFYAVGNHDLDTDGDGFSDAFEILVLGTDPHDPDSHGVYLSGDVLYSGPETGTIYVQAVTESADAWSKTWQTSLAAPGPYTNLVANQQAYWFKAYLDVSGNQQHEEWEPWGLYSATAITATNDLTGLDITLEDQPSIWGTLDYAGAATGDIHVLASSSANWDTTYSTRISWVQGAEEINGDPVYVSFPVDYSITGLPPGDYIVRAFIDEDGTGQFTHLEEGGQYAVAPITVTNRVTGIDFTIGLDTDDDGIPDWWEMQYYGSATGADAGADADGYGVTNLEKYQHGGNPHVADTSGDGIKDWEAIILGLDLQQSYPLVIVGPGPAGFMLLGGGDPLPVTAGISYKHRTAERSKFIQWPAFIQSEPPVYYTGLIISRDWDEDWCDGTREDKCRLNLAVDSNTQIISDEASHVYKEYDYLGADHYEYSSTVTWTNNYLTEVFVEHCYETDIMTVWTNAPVCGVGYMENGVARHGWAAHAPGTFADWPTNATWTATNRFWTGQAEDPDGLTTNTWTYSYVLTNEYKTADLLTYGNADFASLTNDVPLVGLAWGDEFRHTVTGDPCNPLVIATTNKAYTASLRNLSADEVTFKQRESAYRFTVADTVADHVYSLTWLEYFEPDPATNPGATNQLLNVREVKFVGNGGTVHVGNPVHDTSSTPGTQEELHDFILHPPTEGMGNGSRTITTIKVEIDSVWSDQYPGVDANRLPGSSGGGGYDYLLMGARADNKFYARALVTIEPDVPEVRDRLIFNWAGVSGNSYVLNPANNATLVDNQISLSAGQKEAEHHVFIVGVDHNGDGILQANEIVAKSEYRFKPTTQGQYTTEKTILQVLYWPPGFVFPTAYSFLNSFLNDSAPDGAATAHVAINVNEPKHNVGVLFQGNGTADIKRHAFFTTSDLSHRIYESAEFQESLTIGTFAQRHLEVQNYFNTHTNHVHTFTWDLPALISWGSGSLVSHDLHSAFGTATLSGTAEVMVQREGLEVLSVLVQCLITDLYDWDYNKGNPDARAARVQSGFNTLGNGGHIYRVLVDIWKHDTTIDYSFE